jgi:hypothetical protein
MSNKDEIIFKLKPGELSIHPLSMNHIENKTKDNICLTKFKINKNTKKITEMNYNYKCVYNLDNYNKMMYIPPVGITYTDLLNLYDIDLDNIDSLTRWINDNNKNIYTLSRVINCWIKQNFDLIKKHPESLIKIIKKLHKDDDLKHFDEKLFVKEWIKNTKDIFYIDFVNDLNNNIKKINIRKNKKKI